jgi:hypothetical protein
MDNPFEMLNSRLSNIENLLLELKTPPVQKEIESTGSDEIMTKNEVAELFGVSLVTLTSWQKKGIVPFIRKGGRVYFLRTTVMKSLNEIQIKGR